MTQDNIINRVCLGYGSLNNTLQLIYFSRILRKRLSLKRDSLHFFTYLFIYRICASVIKRAYLGPIKHGLGKNTVVGSDIEELLIKVRLYHILTVLNYVGIFLLGIVILGLTCIVEILCDCLVNKLLLDLGISSIEHFLGRKEIFLFQNKEEAIGSGHSFTLYYVADTTYATYQLVFTGMPAMIIYGKEDIGAPEERNWSAEMQLYDPYHSVSKIQTSKINYHVRGGSSEHYSKSNFKMELEGKKLSLLGMHVEDDWILNSLYDDAGLVHNKVSTSVWREIASYNKVPNDEGMTMEYVELFLGTQYFGVYALTERVDQTTLSLKNEDILYKCRADRIPEEHNYTNEMTDEMRPIFVLKYPKEPVAEDWNPLKDWVNYFCKGQLQTYEQGKALLNMENSVDYNLFTLLICGVDNIRKNVFLVAEYQGDGTYQFKKVPWDMNATWGNPWVYDSTCNYTIYDPSYIENMSTWPTDMDTLYEYNEKEMSALLRDRWEELRKAGVITKEKIYDMLNDEFGYLHGSGAYARNYRKWPNGTEFWQDEFIYEYTDARIDVLDEYFDKLCEEAAKE